MDLRGLQNEAQRHHVEGKLVGIQDILNIGIIYPAQISTIGDGFMLFPVCASSQRRQGSSKVGGFLLV